MITAFKEAKYRKTVKDQTYSQSRQNLSKVPIKDTDLETLI